MDGLECSEVMLSSLNEDYRYDAEYYKKQYLFEDATLKRYENYMVGNVAFVTDGQHGYHEIDEVSPIHMLTAKNAKNWFADLQDAEPLAKWVDDNNKRSSLEEKDIILSTRGTVGNCAIVEKDVLPANIDQDVARIMLTTDRFEPEFIIAYLNSTYGQDWMKRNQTGMVQQGLSLQKVRTIPLPLLGIIFQRAVKQVIASAYFALQQSRKNYSQAEQRLLFELDMSDFSPTDEAISVKTLSETFPLSGRLDAEYYHPKYDKLFQSMVCFECKPLGEIVTIKKSIEPGSDAYSEEGIPFVRISDVNKYGISNPKIRLSPGVVENVELLYPKKNTILLSKDGSVSIAYKMESDTKVITSGALLHLVTKDTSEVLPDYLTLVLNSIVVQLQAERDSSGAIIQHWKPSEIEKVIIPILNMSIQKEIAKRVQESFALRRQSEQLLENAKKAVEIAIEHGEDKAFDWLW